MEKTDIYTIQGTDYQQMTEELLDACALAADIGDKTKRVGLKPNLAVAKPASSGATTHPELVDGVLTYLQAQGFENLVVMESSWVGDTTTRAVRVSGILDVCKKHGVPFIDLQKDDSVSLDAAGMEIKVCKEALRVDYMINMPVVKGHCQTTVTCALKNNKGLIPGSEKRRFHTLGLHKPIAHLNTVVPQDFVLADNICGDLDFEEGGNPVTMNRILAFKDPLLCDSFAAEALGHSPEDIAYIRLAKDLGVGSTDVSHARIHSLREEEKEAMTAAQLYGKMPSPKGKVGRLSVYVKPKDACSACYGSLIYALDRLDERGLLRGREKEIIAIGQGYRGKTGSLGVGNCTKCFRKSLQGCPPKAVDIVRFLQEEWRSAPDE